MGAIKHDYDLVILGQRPAAIAAAERAVTWGARVALVVSPERAPDTALLALAGVDVLCGCYEFYDRSRRGSRLALRVGEPERGDRVRQLHSRAYVLVPDARVVVPAGLAEVPHAAIATAADVDRALQEARPGERAIVCGGRSLRGLELALGLVERGVETRFVTGGATLLPSEGAEADALERLWELDAAARGLQYEYGSEIVGGQVSEAGEITLKTADTAHVADRLFLADRLVPGLEATADLRDWGVTFAGDRVWVDRHLRTTHPQIFACAAALRGHDAESLAIHEALVAVRNALMPRWQGRSPRYEAIAWGIEARPGYARVGPSQAQVRSRGRAAVALDLCVRGAGESPDTAARAIVAETGEILGATVVAENATESIAAFAIAVGQRATIDADFTQTASASGELWAQLCGMWRDRWWQSHPIWQERAKLWFDDRRR
ncbi:MAG: FAD-dependent oxidoreductase [Geitlerinemataceae cyanobacterium]